MKRLAAVVAASAVAVGALLLEATLASSAGADVAADAVATAAAASSAAASSSATASPGMAASSGAGVDDGRVIQLTDSTFTDEIARGGVVFVKFFVRLAALQVGSRVFSVCMSRYASLSCSGSVLYYVCAMVSQLSTDWVSECVLGGPTLTSTTQRLLQSFPTRYRRSSPPHYIPRASPYPRRPRGALTAPRQRAFLPLLLHR